MGEGFQQQAHRLQAAEGEEEAVQEALSLLLKQEGEVGGERICPDR